MEIAFGHLKLAPDAFWGMTILEFRCAYIGLVESVTGERPGARNGEFLTRKELAALMEKYPDDAPAPTM
ncbi:MAG: phage tail assembly chaperone [Alphaproteobacteria bacterium]|nr:phage tail assembly chaperone [Alphaproteobacteria bacterium]